ncbi:hypothetical protein COO60DRAFT_662911 [Scenedesmus sp. NREL 46B-D3]|nr:hypothetical protein COO60DRAFT_662911 [Scenedesmus sp. NREL 46B-D3]
MVQHPGSCHRQHPAAAWLPAALPPHLPATSTPPQAAAPACHDRWHPLLLQQQQQGPAPRCCRPPAVQMAALAAGLPLPAAAQPSPLQPRLAPPPCAGPACHSHSQCQQGLGRQQHPRPVRCCSGPAAGVPLGPPPPSPRPPAADAAAAVGLLLLVVMAALGVLPPGRQSAAAPPSTAAPACRTRPGHPDSLPAAAGCSCPLVAAGAAACFFLLWWAQGSSPTVLLRTCRLLLQPPAAHRCQSRARTAKAQRPRRCHSRRRKTRRRLRPAPGRGRLPRRRPRPGPPAAPAGVGAPAGLLPPRRPRSRCCRSCCSWPAGRAPWWPGCRTGSNNAAHASQGRGSAGA